jgi:phosphatidylglycerol:prolipoprotein diacylglycerol transferase
MHPRLFNIDLFGQSLTVSTYGLLVAMGVMGGIYLGFRNARQVGLRTDDYLDLTFWGLVVALASSRLMFVLTNLERYRDNPWKAFALWEGGLVFYGGVIGAVAFGLYMMWRRGLPFLRSGDVIAPILSIGHAFGRLGCFMAGCCWGKACPRPLGVQFGSESVVYENLAARRHLDPAVSVTTAPLHPVQLYEALGEIVIFGVLLHLARRKRFDGMVFFSYLALYAVLRSVTELFRGDAVRRYLFELPLPALARLLGLPPSEPLLLSTSQAVSLVSATVAVAGLIGLGRRAAAGSAAGAAGPP